MPKVLPSDQGASPSRRIDALTGLRIYAALLVVLFHISLNRFFMGDADVVDAGQRILSNAGWFGVAFFFVLFGYVLMWSARSNDTPISFLWRRIAKIAPNHMVTCAVALLLAGLGASRPWEALTNLFLLHAWVPRDTAFFSINHPSWSLSAELFFYAMFPLLVGPVTGLRRRQLFPAAASLIGLLFVMPLIATLLPVGDTFGSNHVQSPLHGASILQVWFVYAFPPVRLLEFVLGMVAARVVQEDVLPTIPLPLAFLMTAIAYGLSLLAPLLWQMSAIFVLPVVVLIVATAQTPEPPRFLASSAAVRLGEISFALYMVHDIVLTAVGMWFGPVALRLMTALACIAAIVGISPLLAWCLWKLVEVPSNNFLRTLFVPTRRKLEA